MKKKWRKTMSDWTKSISVNDELFTKEEIAENWMHIVRENWRHGWYSNEEIKKKKSSPPYWHVHLGGDNISRTEVYIEQDWVQKIWDKINIGDLKVLRVYLNGHTAGQPGGIHIDGWASDQYTIIYYANPDWTPYDGGTIEFWTPNLNDEQKAMSIDTIYGSPMASPREQEPDILRAYWPKPGRVVTFDARIPHCATPVHPMSNKFRVSLVFKCTKLQTSFN